MSDGRVNARKSTSYSEPYGGGAISFHDEVCVFSLGAWSRMYFDSEILSDAASLHLRSMRSFNEETVMEASAWQSRMWSPRGVSFALFFFLRPLGVR